MSINILLQSSLSLLIFIVLYILDRIQEKVSDRQCDFFFFEIIFLKTLCCKRFPCCHRSFIMRPKIGKRARVWFFYSFASFPLIFFKIPFIFEGCLTSMSRSIQRFSVLAGSTGAACVRRIYCFHSV